MKQEKISSIDNEDESHHYVKSQNVLSEAVPDSDLQSLSSSIGGLLQQDNNTSLNNAGFDDCKKMHAPRQQQGRPSAPYILSTAAVVTAKAVELRPSLLRTSFAPKSSPYTRQHS